jgi:hypothetical protein
VNVDEQRFRDHVRQAVRWFAIDLKHPRERKQYLDDIKDPASIHFMADEQYRERFETALRQQWTFDGIDRNTGVSRRLSWEWQGATA